MSHLEPSDPTAGDTGNETLSADHIEETAERHATNLELFLDLVFVFAVTQIATLLATVGTAASFGRGLLLTWLVWWLWSQFTWLGTAVDLDSRSLNQLLILIAVPLTLLMAVALPDAYGASGTKFAGAYLAVSLWSIAIQGRGLWGVDSTRRAFLQYAPLASIAPCALLLGSLLDRGPRTAIWALVAILQIGSALFAGRKTTPGSSEWTIDPLHFAERHSLFVIISLGEVLVAAGLAASAVALDSSVGLAIVAAVSVACALWWAYFSYIPSIIEERLRMSHGGDRGRVARNVFSFGHFPIIFGIVLYAVAAKHVIAHPAQVLHSADLYALALGIAIFVAGLSWLQWLMVGRVARERIAIMIAVPVLCAAVGPHIAGTILVSLIAAMLIVAQTIIVRRFVRNLGSAVTESSGTTSAEATTDESHLTD